MAVDRGPANLAVFYADQSGGPLWTLTLSACASCSLVSPM